MASFVTRTEGGRGGDTTLKVCLRPPPPPRLPTGTGSQGGLGNLPAQEGGFTGHGVRAACTGKRGVANELPPDRTVARRAHEVDLIQPTRLHGSTADKPLRRDETTAARTPWARGHTRDHLSIPKDTDVYGPWRAAPSSFKAHVGGVTAHRVVLQRVTRLLSQGTHTAVFAAVRRDAVEPVRTDTCCGLGIARFRSSAVWATNARGAAQCRTQRGRVEGGGPHAHNVGGRGKKGAERQSHLVSKNSEGVQAPHAGLDDRACDGFALFRSIHILEKLLPQVSKVIDAFAAPVRIANRRQRPGAAG